MKLKINNKLKCFLLIFIYLNINTTTIFARAGGGTSGGHSSGGYTYHGRTSSLDCIFLIGILAFIYILIMFFSFIGGLFDKKREKLLSKTKTYTRFIDEDIRKYINNISIKDTKYNLDNLISTIKEVYFAIQNSWNTNTLDENMEYMTLNMCTYLKKKRKKSKAVHYNPGNKIDDLGITDIKLHEIRFVSVNTISNQIIVVIIGSMVDDLYSLELRETEHEIPKFYEFWTFYYINDAWKLSSINQINEKKYIKQIGICK